MSRKRNNKSNSKDSNRRGDSRGNRTARSETKGNGSSSYWMNVGQLAIDATTISTFQPAGAKMDKPILPKGYYTPAGILRVDYTPYFGHIDSAIDPINVAAKRLYDEINSKNSRNPSYDPSDLMIYIIAVANAWSLWSFTRRICGMYPLFSPVNRYWWQPVLETMGISPISVRNDIVAWRNVCNRIALNLNRLAVPNNIPYFSEVINMCADVYMDAPTEKSSFYYYNPAGIMMYSYDTGDQLGLLKNTVTPWYDPDKAACTPEDIEDYFQRLTHNLFNDTDINTMASDIIKAYGMENCFTLPMIDETYIVEPKYSDMANLKLHNARIATSTISEGNRVYEEYGLKQNMHYNGLYSFFHPSYKHDTVNTADVALIINDAKGSGQVALDFPYDNPSNMDVMEATRFTWYGSIEFDGAEHRNINACTCLLVDMTAWTFKENSQGEWDLDGESVANLGWQGNSISNLPTLLNKMELMSKFHCLPVAYVVNGSSADHDGYANALKSYIISDLTNYTTISTKVLRNINEAAIFSIFLPASNVSPRS